MSKCKADMNEVLTKVAEEFCTSELKELRKAVKELEKREEDLTALNDKLRREIQKLTTELDYKDELLSQYDEWISESLICMLVDAEDEVEEFQGTLNNAVEQLVGMAIEEIKEIKQLGKDLVNQHKALKKRFPHE